MKTKVKMMKAIVVKAYGSPEVLKLEKGGKTTTKRK